MRAVDEISRLHLEPGDALAVRFKDDHPISQQQAEAVRENIRKTLGRPDLPVLIYGPDIELTVIEHGED